MARQENPIEKYGMARYDVANKKPRDQTGTFQTRGGNQARDEARAAASEQTAPTFAELQNQGRARPAPPAIQPLGRMGMMQSYTDLDGPEPEFDIPGRTTPTYRPQTPPQTPYATPTAGMAPGTPTAETLGQGPAQPAGDPRWNSILANLEAQFAGQRSRLNEDLARRGMFASTGELGAGARLGDLEGQQSRAIASAKTEYEMARDNRYDDLMRMLLPYIMGNGG